MKISEAYSSIAKLAQLTDCIVCPRNCHADRTSWKRGSCNAGAGLEISSVCIHRGEEPVISGMNGICNVFFSRCNLQCIYCQNLQISSNSNALKMSEWSLEEVTLKICSLLDKGCHAVGFVSPSHMVPQMLQIIGALHALGRKPVIVYNTNAYEKVEILRNLEGIIDVYIPDFKYSDPELAGGLSDARDYPVVAQKAITEMFRQKGTPLITDADNQAISGLIIRHLVLPGQVGNSLNVLRYIAGELSPRIHISLMSQYHPMPAVKNHAFLGRGITETEYQQVVEEMERLGFDNGWVQTMNSNTFYLPDFNNEHPFESGFGNFTN